MSATLAACRPIVAAVKRVRGGEVLFVCPVTPADAGNGLAMRAGLFLAGLSRSHAVEVFVAPANFGPADDLRLLLERRKSRERVEALHPRPALSAGATLAAARAVADRAAGFDLVHVMRLYLAPLLDVLLDAVARPRLSLDLDDLDADLFASLGEAAEADAFGRMERYYIPRVDAACLAAAGDCATLAARAGAAHISCLPNAVRPPASLALAPRRHDLLFVGNLSYAANVDATHWLCREVLPLLPGATLAIAGQAPPAAVRDLAQLAGVTILADPSDVAPLYAASALVVAPLRHGGGTPIKVIEALAHERAVVATSVAAAGLPDGLVTVADVPAAFADACRALLDDDDLRLARARSGRAYVLAERSVDVVGEQIGRWVSTILAA
jgi:glycosyltransferase involved in cell wall biosynthesis